MKREGTVRGSPLPSLTVALSTVPYRRLFHNNHLLRKPTPIDDKLINVDAGCRYAIGLQHLAIPVRRKCARSRGATGQLEIVELLARALQNRRGDELCQHVVGLEGVTRPMTIGKQIAVQGERDRGRRIERVRIVLLQLDQRRRGRLSEHTVCT